MAAADPPASRAAGPPAGPTHQIAAGTRQLATHTHPLAGPTRPRATTHRSPCRDARLNPTSGDVVRIDAAVLCLLNRVRGSHHLRPLRLNNDLQGVAAGQTHDMVSGDYFGDNSLSGQTPMQRILATPYPAGAVHLAAAQNIGWATGPDATPTGIVDAWMSSPPHRAIILTASYRDVGVGVTPAAPSSLAHGLSGATYTLEFGLRVFSAKPARARRRH
ncbi:MAG TPA: CAP domain-containing protein [Solirubrobacteraceae bacterium]